MEWTVGWKAIRKRVRETAVGVKDDTKDKDKRRRDGRMAEQRELTPHALGTWQVFNQLR